MSSAHRHGDAARRRRFLALLVASALLGSVPARGQHGHLPPPGRPQVAALAVSPEEGVTWVLGRKALWRLDHATGRSEETEHPPLTTRIDQLDEVGARPLPVAALHLEGRRLLAFLEGGRVRTYRLATAPTFRGESASPGRVRAGLRAALESSGRSHLALWPGREAAFEAGDVTVTLRPREVVVDAPSGRRVLAVPGLTYRDLVRYRPDQRGRLIAAEAGVGPFALDGDALWIGLSFPATDTWTGTGGLVRVDLDEPSLELLRPPPLVTRSARALAVDEDRLVLAAGNYLEGRWWHDGEPPGESVWLATDAAFVTLTSSTRGWHARPALGQPVGIEAPTSLAVVGGRTWAGLGWGVAELTAAGEARVLWGAIGPVGPLARLDAATLRHHLTEGFPTQRSDAALWLRRVRLGRGVLEDVLVRELASADPTRRALSAAACGWQRETACLPALLRAFERETDGCAEMAMARALARLGAVAAVPAIAGRAEERRRREWDAARVARSPERADVPSAAHGPARHANHHAAPGAPPEAPRHGDGPDAAGHGGACHHVEALAGEGPGGSHSLVDALIDFRGAAVPHVRAWLVGDRAELRPMALRAAESLAPFLSPEDAKSLLRRDAADLTMDPQDALAAVASVAATRDARSHDMTTVRRGLAALQVLEQHWSSEAEGVVRSALSHPVVGGAALDALARHEGGASFLRRELHASEDAAVVARLVGALARASEEVPLSDLRALAERMRAEGWRRDRTSPVHRAMLSVLRYGGTVPTCEMWQEIAAITHSRADTEAAAYECPLLAASSEVAEP